jgi:peptidoglycan hydrolase-like protein with peptidoglycan-binding domain
MTRQARDRRAVVIALVGSVVLIGAIQVVGSNGGGNGSLQTVDAGTAATTTLADAAATPTTGPAAATSATAPLAVPAAQTDLVGDEPGAAGECTMKERSAQYGSSGPDVSCIQQALIDEGFYDGPVTGEFDMATFAAVELMQENRELYVDGVVGRESAIELGIWPDEASLVVRTPKPPAGAVDLLGYPLSSVASAGADAPPLPPNSGSGKRVVYDRAQQRVWAVDRDGRIVRSWLISGSKYANELPGTHEVYSRSDMSTAWNGKAYLPMMIRWLKTERGAIGFHAIPRSVADGSKYQTEDELGQRLSGGCQRQADRDAAFLWDFAPVGTTVVVI